MEILENTICVICHKDCDDYWEINPPGGYGMSQCVVCDSCIKTDVAKFARKRLEECGDNYA